MPNHGSSVTQRKLVLDDFNPYKAWKRSTVCLGLDNNIEQLISDVNFLEARLTKLEIAVAHEASANELAKRVDEIKHLASQLDLSTTDGDDYRLFTKNTRVIIANLKKTRVKDAIETTKSKYKTRQGQQIDQTSWSYLSEIDGYNTKQTLLLWSYYHGLGLFTTRKGLTLIVASVIALLFAAGSFISGVYFMPIIGVPIAIAVICSVLTLLANFALSTNFVGDFLRTGSLSLFTSLLRYGYSHDDIKNWQRQYKFNKKTGKFEPRYTKAQLAKIKRNQGKLMNWRRIAFILLAAGSTSAVFALVASMLTLNSMLMMGIPILITGLISAAFVISLFACMFFSYTFLVNQNPFIFKGLTNWLNDNFKRKVSKEVLTDNDGEIIGNFLDYESFDPNIHSVMNITYHEWSIKHFCFGLIKILPFLLCVTGLVGLNIASFPTLLLVLSTLGIVGTPALCIGVVMATMTISAQFAFIANQTNDVLATTSNLSNMFSTIFSSKSPWLKKIAYATPLAALVALILIPIIATVSVNASLGGFAFVAVSAVCALMLLATGYYSLTTVMPSMFALLNGPLSGLWHYIERNLEKDAEESPTPSPPIETTSQDLTFSTEYRLLTWISKKTTKLAFRALTGSSYDDKGKGKRVEEKDNAVNKRDNFISPAPC